MGLLLVLVLAWTRISQMNPFYRVQFASGPDLDMGLAPEITHLGLILVDSLTLPLGFERLKLYIGTRIPYSNSYCWR